MNGRATQPIPMAVATPRAIQRQIGVARTIHTEGSSPAVTTTLEPRASSGLVAASVIARVSTAKSTSTKTNADTVSPGSQGTGSGSGCLGFQISRTGSRGTSGGSTTDTSPVS